MIKFIKPTNFNGADLESELLIKGIKLQSLPEVIGDDLFLAIDESESKVTGDVVKKHNGNIIPTDNSVKKAALFERLGMTPEEIAIIIG